MRIDRRYALSRIRIEFKDARLRKDLTVRELVGGMFVGKTQVLSRDVGRIENGSADLVDEGVFRRILLVLGVEDKQFDDLIYLHKVARKGEVHFRWRDMPRRKHSARREYARVAVRG